MKKDRSDIVQAMRAQGNHDRALQAVCSLPRIVDTDTDALVLRELGIGEDTLQTRAPVT